MSNKKAKKQNTTKEKSEKICECASKNCSFGPFLAKYNHLKKEDEPLGEFIIRMGFVSSQLLFPVWHKECNSIKNKMNKYLISRKHLSKGVDYFILSGKDHKQSLKEAKSIGSLGTSWSITCLSQNLYKEMRMNMLKAKWGYIAGIHEQEAIFKLFGSELKKVTYDVFLSAVVAFYDNFPAWKAIKKSIKEMQISYGKHQKAGLEYVEKWTKAILNILVKMLVSKDKKRNNINFNLPPNKITLDIDICKSFFNCFAGMAYSLVPDHLPYENVLMDKGFSDSKERNEDILNYWATCSILPISQKQAEETLIDGTIPDGSFLISISEDYFLEMALEGIHNKVTETNFCKNYGPFFVSFKQKGKCFHHLITLKSMQFSLSSFIFSFKEVSQCYLCGASNCKKSFHSPLPKRFHQSISTESPSYSSPVYSNNTNRNKRVKKNLSLQSSNDTKVIDSSESNDVPRCYNNIFPPNAVAPVYANPSCSSRSNFSFNFKNSTQHNTDFNNIYPNHNNTNNNVNNNNIYPNHNINNNNVNNNNIYPNHHNPNFNNQNVTKFSPPIPLPYKQVGSGHHNYPYKSLPLPFGSSFSVRDESLSHQTLPKKPIPPKNLAERVSYIHLKIKESPSFLLKNTVIVVAYCEDKSYYISCSDLHLELNCLIPFIGKESHLEQKVFSLDDPLISETFILKYKSSSDEWSIGSLEMDKFFTIQPGMLINSELPLGGTVIECIFQSFRPKSIPVTTESQTVTFDITSDLFTSFEISLSTDDLFKLDNY